MEPESRSKMLNRLRHEAPGWDEWDFKASDHNLPRLDDKNLTQLLLETYSNIVIGKRLRHGFIKGLKEHGIKFALGSLREQMPYRFNKFANLVASRRITLEEAIGYNNELQSCDLREIAQRIYESGNSYQADEITKYAKRVFSGDVTAEESSEVLGNIVESLCSSADGRVSEFASLLHKIQSSDEPRKHDDLETVLGRKRSRLSGDIEYFYTSNIRDRVGDALGSVTKVAPPLVAITCAIALGYLGWSVLGNSIRDRYVSEDKDRTLYIAEHMPDRGLGLANTAFMVIDAGNLSASMDKGYMAVSQGLPLDYYTMADELKIQVHDTRAQIEVLLAEYDDPRLSIAVSVVQDGANRAAGSISHSEYVDTTTICTPITTCSPETSCSNNSCTTSTSCTTTISCVTYFNFRDDFWRVNKEAGQQGITSVKRGLRDGQVNNRNQALADLDLPYINRDEFNNTHNPTIDSYNRSVVSIGQIQQNVAVFDSMWPNIPLSFSNRSYSSESRQSWEPESLVFSIRNSASGLDGFKSARAYLSAYREQLEKASDRLESDIPPKEIFSNYMGDSSIDIIRALGYPGGKGHLYAGEIEGAIRAWRIGLGLIGLGISVAGYIIYENGEEQRRFNRYRGY
jgi:hypothetical protein